MIVKRIIPCLDIKDGRVVKGVRFEGLRDVEDPVVLARFYDDNQADELVFYDIAASREGRPIFIELLRRVAECVHIPLMAGGGIAGLEDFDRVLDCGADKVSVNSGALRDPELLRRAAEKYGSRRVVLSMDVRRVGDVYRVFAEGGQTNTGRDALEWARLGEELGAGEIVLNSIDTDGVRGGFDLPMLEAVGRVVSVPIVASGGAGTMQDFAEAFRIPGVGAGLSAGAFHSKTVLIPELKRYLRERGVPVRIEEPLEGRKEG